MENLNDLEKVPVSVIQNIYRCLFQAVGEDYQEAENHLGFETHVSKPFMIWDLIYRNLIRSFASSDILYSTKKRGMWEIMLLYDKESKMLLSFMRDARFKSIRKAKRGNRPEYIRALLTLNSGLQAEVKQQNLFDDKGEPDESQLINLLDSLCTNFMEPVIDEVHHHALVVFSSNYGQVTSLKAMILDSDLDVVTEQDWLDVSRPMLSNEVSVAEKSDNTYKLPSLKSKAIKLKKQKELVSLKTSDEDLSEQI